MCDIEGNYLTSAAILGHDSSAWALSDKFTQEKTMGQTSDALLELEKNCSSTEKSVLVVCKNDESILKTKTSVTDAQKKYAIAPLPPSQLLTKMKDFLGAMSEANERLKLDAKDKSSKDFDIEVLSGNESQLIEMDLILGIADLNTPEAVAAAESAIAGNQPVIPIATSDSDSEYDSNSDEEDDDDDDDGDEDEDIESKDEESNKTCSPAQTEKSKSREDKSSLKASSARSTKRPKIIEIS